MRLSLALSLLGMLVLVLPLVGCGENDPFDPERQRRGPAMGVGGALAPIDLDVQDSAAKPPPPPPPANDQANTSDTGTPPPPPPPPPPPANTTTDEQTPPVDPNVERVEAGVGVETKKGHGYGSGPIATPVAAYFSVRERIALMMVDKGLQTYKALNGHAPKTHEEFMEKIIKEGAVDLPQLRTDEHRYVYDPETEQLMVEWPR